MTPSTPPSNLLGGTRFQPSAALSSISPGPSTPHFLPACLLLCRLLLLPVSMGLSASVLLPLLRCPVPPCRGGRPAQATTCILRMSAPPCWPPAGPHLAADRVEPLPRPSAAPTPTPTPAAARTNAAAARSEAAARMGPPLSAAVKSAWRCCRMYLLRRACGTGKLWGSALLRRCQATLKHLQPQTYVPALEPCSQKPHHRALCAGPLAPSSAERRPLEPSDEPHPPLRLAPAPLGRCTHLDMRNWSRAKRRKRRPSACRWRRI
jgi:hypothetical protein